MRQEPTDHEDAQQQDETVHIGVDPEKLAHLDQTFITPPRGDRTIPDTDPTDDDRTLPVDPQAAADRGRPGSHPVTHLEGVSSGGGTVPFPETGEERYQVSGELGRGGMGLVLVGHDRTMRREVAIKVMRHPGKVRREHTARFLEEAQIQGQLDHPNICPIHELGMDAEGRPYFTMKRVQGRPLSEILESSPANDPAQLTRHLRLFMKVCDGIAFAHSRGVIHRDLKPANIMVGEFGEVLVMDWGLARVMSRDEDHPRPMVTTMRQEEPSLQSMEGEILGTPSYMAPEQANGELSLIGPATDTYALGGVLYRILVGRAPHQGDSTADSLESAREGRLPEFPTPAAEIASFCRELQPVILKTLNKEPIDRYSSVSALQRDISAFLDGRPLSVGSYTIMQRARKWVRRHRYACGAAALVLLAGLGTFGVVAWNAQRELDQKLERFQERVSENSATWAHHESSVAQALNAPQENFREPNGELILELVDGWYGTLDEAVTVLEARAALAAQAPTDEARSSVKVKHHQQRAQELCKKAAMQAVDWGHNEFAKGWVTRAEANGLSRALADETRTRLEERRQERIEKDLEVARGHLRTARQQTGAGSGFLDGAVVDLVRRRSPHMVRLLLDPAHVRSSQEWERWLVIEALGRIGDTRTKGAEGLDAVEVLSQALEKLSLKDHQKEAIAVANALGFLGDPRGHEALYQKRWGLGPAHPFVRETKTAMTRIKLPERFGGAGGEKTADDFVETGLRRAAAGDGVGAIAAYTEALKLDPSNEDARVNRGVQRLIAGDAKGAVADHTEAIKRNPDAVNAYHNRGNAWITLREPKKALADFNAALKILPDNVNALGGRAQAYTHLDQLDKAIEDYTAALKLSPEDPMILNNRGIARMYTDQLEKALEDFGEAIRLSPDRTLAWQNRGALLARMGRVSEGIADLDEALRRRPNHLPFYFTRASIYTYYANQPDKAIDDLNVCCKGEPDNPGYFHERGYARERGGFYDVALRDYDRALTLDNSRDQTHHRRGIVLHYLGRPEDAVESLTNALNLKPDFPTYLWDRAQVEQVAGLTEEAAEDYQKVTELQPNRKDAYIRWGKMLQRLGQREESVAALTAYLDGHPDDLLVLGHRADLYRELGRYKEAVADFTRALDDPVAGPGAHWGRGWCYLSLEEPEKAEQDGRDGLKKEGSSFRMEALIGQALLDQKRTKEAYDVLEQCAQRADLDALAWWVVLRGRIANNKGAEALTAFDQIEALNPDSTEYLLDGVTACALVLKTDPGKEDAMVERASGILKMIKSADVDALKDVSQKEEWAPLLKDPRIQELLR